MITEIKQYIREMRGITKRDDVLKTVSNSIVNINKSVIPTISKVSEFYSKHSVDIDRVKVAKDLNNYSGINGKDIPEMLKDMKRIYTDIGKSEATLNKLVMDNFTDLISNGNLTAREVAILKSIDDISDMGMYVMDYLYLLVNRHPDLKDEEVDKGYLIRVKVNEIYRGLYPFASTLKAYRDFPKYLKDLAQVADVNVREDSNETLLRSSLSKLGKIVTLPNVKGFRGNPIYHFRMWLVDRDVKRLENLKDKQKMTELKIMELKSKADGSENPRLTKQIEYYEKKLALIEYKIRKEEEKVDG